MVSCIWPMQRQERNISWCHVREVDGSEDTALDLICRSLKAVNDH